MCVCERENYEGLLIAVKISLPDKIICRRLTFCVSFGESCFSRHLPILGKISDSLALDC